MRRVVLSGMRRITGAAALAYVVLAAIENMELLGMPRLGGSPAAIEAAFADTALGTVTVSAGALSLLCYAAFAAALLRLGSASWRWLAPAVLGAGLAGAGVATAALLVAGGDTGLFDLQLQLRYLAGPLMALFLIGAGRAGVLPPMLSRSALVVAAPLVLAPLALTESASLQLLAQLAFAANAAWIWLAGLWLACGGPGLVRRSAFLMLVLAAGLVGLALLAVPDATGVFFAWGLGPDSLAAFAGGVYVASAAVYAVALRAPAREAHGLVVAAVVLSVSVLASTLAHLDVFDFGRLQAWAWLALFVAFGITTTVLAVRGPWWPAPGPRLPVWTRLLLGVVAGLLAGIGLALWIDPSAFSLAPLGGRFAGSWVAMLATLAAWAALTNRRREARLPALALVALPAGALVAAARTDGRPGYLLALALLVAAGAAILAVSEAPGGAARRARRGPNPGTSTAASTPQPWSDGSDAILTPRSRSFASVASRSSVIRYSSCRASPSSAGWTASSAGGSAKISQPPPASTDWRPSTSAKNARAASASGANRMEWTALINRTARRGSSSCASCAACASGSRCRSAPRCGSRARSRSCAPCRRPSSRG